MYLYYILVELNYKYHLYLFFKNQINLYLKLYLANKFIKKLKKFKIIY